MLAYRDALRVRGGSFGDEARHIDINNNYLYHCVTKKLNRISIDCKSLFHSQLMPSLHAGLQSLPEHNMTTTRTLPDEVLTLICEELGQQRDFGSIFRCAQTSSTLADPALRTMYR